MKWAKNPTNDDKLRCACCDRVITGEAVWVTVVDGGSQIALPGSNVDPDDPSYLGGYPVGPTCARKLSPEL